MGAEALEHSTCFAGDHELVWNGVHLEVRPRRAANMYAMKRGAIGTARHIARQRKATTVLRPNVFAVKFTAQIVSQTQVTHKNIVSQTKVELHRLTNESQS